MDLAEFTRQLLLDPDTTPSAQVAVKAKDGPIFMLKSIELEFHDAPVPPTLWLHVEEY